MESSSELNDFLSRVNEVEGLVRDIATATDTDSVNTALNRADSYLSRGGEEEGERAHLTSNSSTSSSGTVVGFNRTVINPNNTTTTTDSSSTSRADGADSSGMTSGGTDQVAFCKALEEDAKERAEKREKRLILGNRMKRDGNEAFRQERYKEALTHYTEAIQQLPGEVILYTNRALTHLKLGHFDEVLNDCETALKFNEMTLKAYLYKGKALISLDRDNEARHCFDTALSLLPDKQTTIRSYVKNIENWNCDL